MFYRIETTGTHMGGHVAYRAILLPINPLGRERLVGVYDSYDEAVEAVMNPFNPLYMEDLEDHEWIVAKSERD